MAGRLRNREKMLVFFFMTILTFEIHDLLKVD